MSQGHEILTGLARTDSSWEQPRERVCPSEGSLRWTVCDGAVPGWGPGTWDSVFAAVHSGLRTSTLRNLSIL